MKVLVVNVLPRLKITLKGLLSHAENSLITINFFNPQQYTFPL